MGEANENRRRINSSSVEMSNLSLQIEEYPRDLLQRFISNESQASIKKEQDDEVDEELELNLGLSLGGRFGVDKNANKLVRASSIAGSIPIFRDDGVKSNNTPPKDPNYTTLIRTTSLPTETEEEWRKRKKMQCLRRMEAKRRRSEKQKCSREKMEVNLLEEDNKKPLRRTNSNNIGVGLPFGLAATARPPCYQSSIGRSSSNMSELEYKASQGASICGEARRSGSSQCLQDKGNQEGMPSPGTKVSETVHKTVGNEGKEHGSAMEDMPCVFTKGDGPNGKRIDGILYKYGKGEEVRIMCVCHGNFLSPAEFVKHAGGGDVDQPLRHIVKGYHATLSNRDVDCCLIPETEFYLEGHGGLFEFLGQKLKERGHAVVVVVEGGGQDSIPRSRAQKEERDESSNIVFLDVGSWSKSELKKWWDRDHPDDF